MFRAARGFPSSCRRGAIGGSTLQSTVCRTYDTMKRRQYTHPGWKVDSGRSDNPFVRFRRVRCPKELVDISGSRPNDDDAYPAIKYPRGSRGGGGNSATPRPTADPLVRERTPTPSDYGSSPSSSFCCFYSASDDPCNDCVENVDRSGFCSMSKANCLTCKYQGQLP